MKLAALHLNNLLEYAQVRGVSPAAVLSPRRLPFINCQDETLLIPVASFYEALAAVSQELKDELWGIKAGKFLTLKLLGLIYRISLQATTIAEAFYYLQSYLVATLPLVTAQTHITGEQIKITLRIDNDEEKLNRIILENVLTIISREISMMAAQAVSFTLTSPYFNALYPKDWETGKCFSVAFEPVLLKVAFKNRREEQLDILVPAYLKLMELCKATDTGFSNKVKITMLALSDPHLPDIATVSEALYLTPRSLQRRLARENSSFRELLQELKKQICSFLLRHQGYSVTNMAYVLGYAEPASFIHSFKNWFGDSPERIRQSLLKRVAEE